VLGPETPLLKLPPDFAKDTPPIKIHRISEYDKDGPFWAWNWLELGEHSAAPISTRRTTGSPARIIPTASPTR
jgi:kynurenine formamidase